MQIDGGFTAEGFLANLALQVVSILGVLFVALIVYRKTTADERARFQQQIEHDLAVRRAEDELRRKKRDEQDRKQRASIRIALYCEIADNLAVLAEFWPKIASEGERPVGIAQVLINTEVPVWRTSVWHGVAALLALALESWEIGRVQRVYATLAAIRGTQDRLAATASRDIANAAAQPEMPSPIRGMAGTRLWVPPDFDPMANALIPELRDRIDEILAQGNPIRVESEAQSDGGDRDRR